MTGLDPESIRTAYEAACLDELDALKPGNVHRHADGHRMRVADFETSASVSATAIAELGTPVGRRILGAIESTRVAVGQNTNLGIVLLAAPLAVAAERASEARDLRAALADVLADLTQGDAADAFAAIRLASPAGLGRSDAHDVSAAPTVSLIEAMRAAAGRDRIARQYDSVFADVFETGLPALDRASRRGASAHRATAAVYLAFLSAFPDSHVERKFGAATAEALRCEAGAVAARETEADGLPPVATLLSFDADLKRRGINPGTSADLTVATLFAARLSRHLAAMRQ